MKVDLDPSWAGLVGILFWPVVLSLGALIHLLIGALP